MDISLAGCENSPAELSIAGPPDPLESTFSLSSIYFIGEISKYFAAQLVEFSFSLLF